MCDRSNRNLDVGLRGESGKGNIELEKNNFVKNYGRYKKEMAFI